MKAIIAIVILVVSGYAVTASFGVATAKTGAHVIKVRTALIDAQ